MFKKGVDRGQVMLLPKCVEDYVPHGHLARIVCTIVDRLNIEKIISKFSRLGQNAYNPFTLICILFYGYAIGIRSSRQLSSACGNRLDFMYLSRELAPSYKVISEFRRKNLEELKGVFKEIVHVGKEIGLVKIGSIKTSTDGTKIRANASSKKTKDEEALKESLKEVDEAIQKIFDEAEQVDQTEDKEYGDKRGDEIPKEVAGLESQKQKIEKAIKTLEDRKEAKRQEKLKEKREKSGQRGESEEKEVKLTKKEEEKIDKTKINLTDNDANYMKERNGCIKTNYNCQISVEEDEQFIVANDVTTEPNDSNQLVQMVEKSEENIEAKVDLSKADAGYHNIDNLKAMAESNHECLIDDPNKKRVDNPNHKFDKVNFGYEKEKDEYRCPADHLLTFKGTKKKDDEVVRIYESNACLECPFKIDCCGKDKKRRLIERRESEELVETNRERLLSAEGKEEYKKRMHTVEPPFGHLKFNLGYRHFLVRGTKKVSGEFNLMCIGYDLKKIAKKVMEKGIDLLKMQQIAFGTT